MMEQASEAPVASSARAIKYGRLKKHHPDYDPKYLRNVLALHRGGRALLKNKEVMEELFPKFLGETAASYEERKRRAFYVNHFASVINFIIAGLAQDPLRLEPDEKKEDEQAELPEFWAELVENAGAPTTKRHTIDQLMRQVVRDALVCDWSWVLCDLPRPMDVAPVSLADQEAAGLLKGYFVHLSALSVVDWEERGGQLQWIRTYECTTPAATPSADRNVTVHTYRVWDAVGWARYEVLVEKGKQPPPDDTMIAPIEEGEHSFGRVPVVRFLLDEGLRAGDMLYSLAVEYLNQSCADSWSRFQDGNQQLYEFQGAEIPGVDTPIGTAQQDTERGKKGRRGPGTVQIRGADDDAKYVGPDMGGSDVKQKALSELKDDIYRITGQMALSQDTSGAMIRRSGESKKQDATATEVVLGALGAWERSSAQASIELLAIGAAQSPPPTVAGAERFDVQDAAALIEQTAVVDTLDIPSATFHQEKAMRVARSYFGDDISEAKLAEIEKELKTTITPERFLQQQKLELEGGGDKGGKKDEAPPGGSA